MQTHTLEKLKARLETTKAHQAVPLPRVAAALAVQTEVIEALMELVSDLEAKLQGMAHFLDQLGVAAEATAPQTTTVLTGEIPEAPAPSLSSAPPAPALELERRPGLTHHNAAEGVQMRPRPQSAPDPSAPSFSTTPRELVDVHQHQRRSGQHPSEIPGVTPSEDLNLHAGIVATGPAKAPTVPPPMQVYGPGAPGGAAPVSFRPADPPVDASQSAAGAPREPVVELRAPEPERSDATVEFKPAEPPVEAKPHKPQE